MIKCLCIYNADLNTASLRHPDSQILPVVVISPIKTDPGQVICIRKCIQSTLNRFFLFRSRIFIQYGDLCIKRSYIPIRILYFPCERVSSCLRCINSSAAAQYFCQIPVFLVICKHTIPVPVKCLSLIDPGFGYTGKLRNAVSIISCFCFCAGYQGNGHDTCDCQLPLFLFHV